MHTHVPGTDYCHPTHVCDDDGCQMLNKTVQTISPHTDVEAKRAQRKHILTLIEATLQVQCRANVYLFDDWLPTIDGLEEQTLLVEDIRRQFGTDRVRIWAPNLKEDIVDTQRSLVTEGGCPPGWLTAGCGC